VYAPGRSAKLDSLRRARQVWAEDAAAAGGIADTVIKRLGRRRIMRIATPQTSAEGGRLLEGHYIDL